MLPLSIEHRQLVMYEIPIKLIDGLQPNHQRLSNRTQTGTQCVEVSNSSAVMIMLLFTVTVYSIAHGHKVHACLALSKVELTCRLMSADPHWW